MVWLLRPRSQPLEALERVFDKGIRVTVAEREGPGLGIISTDAVVLTLSGEVITGWLVPPDRGRAA